MTTLDAIETEQAPSIDVATPFGHYTRYWYVFGKWTIEAQSRNGLVSYSPIRVSITEDQYPNLIKRAILRFLLGSTWEKIA